MKCTISYHGPAHKWQINISKSFIIKDFPENRREYTLFFNGNYYYTKLPKSFFNTCPHLRTAYKSTDYKGINYLHKWLESLEGNSVEVTKTGNVIELRQA